jgi:hypothetical protein
LRTQINVLAGFVKLDHTRKGDEAIVPINDEKWICHGGLGRMTIPWKWR